MRDVAVLPPVTPDQHAAIQAAPRTAAAHRALMDDITAFGCVQLGGEATQGVLPADLSVVAWNVERLLFAEESAAHLAGAAPDIVLLSEVDHGMARTQQMHTTERMAAAMGMAYAYGVEFHELDLGGPTERPLCVDDFNALGWHGNAILSKVPFARTALVRLDDHGHWFSSDEGFGDPEQPRVGGRMALLAEVPTQAGPLCLVSTHLESNSAAAHRAAQFDLLMDAIDQFAGDMPVLLGGDLNTGNHLPPDFDWQRETLFDAARLRGYDWSATPDGMTTRPSLITPHPTRVMKLDWFALRGLRSTDCALIPAITAQGKPLSDHEAIWARVSR
ncbi:endonuclease/exonuclease/phosphatase family protein [Sulfitobacter sp. S190]|uniref:endonuclease/exonuclease/phosphatase family protein n=1 Tax=Sulfitobacter sp. S190 TaxID=2867022 RepID=UPI0021A8DE2C|nr:endonuclease/exonuclease/phosphatase family protein [Sulfitobacter sp. S190]UWR22600.1 endonuclease/exonuclease/phosphatase family protein [Sulfitobacter sp. S190]